MSGLAANSTGAFRAQQEEQRHPEQSRGTGSHLKGIHQCQHRGMRHSLQPFRGAATRWSMSDNEPTAHLTPAQVCALELAAQGCSRLPASVWGLQTKPPPLQSFLQQCCHPNSRAGKRSHQCCISNSTLSQAAGFGLSLSGREVN